MRKSWRFCNATVRWPQPMRVQRAMQSRRGRRSAASRIPRSSARCCGRRSLWWRERSKSTRFAQAQAFPLISVTQYRDRGHRLFPGDCDIIHLLGGVPLKRKANETHHDAMDRERAVHLISPRHLGRAVAEVPYRQRKHPLKHRQRRQSKLCEKRRPLLMTRRPVKGPVLRVMTAVF